MRWIQVGGGSAPAPATPERRVKDSSSTRTTAPNTPESLSSTPSDSNNNVQQQHDVKASSSSASKKSPSRSVMKLRIGFRKKEKKALVGTDETAEKKKMENEASGLQNDSKKDAAIDEPTKWETAVAPDTGLVYYFNKEAQVSTYERPACLGPSSKSEIETKICYFTGNPIGKNATYYTAQIESASAEKAPVSVYTTASSMKLLGCPTICDDDLLRMDRLYFAQHYRRLPEKLRLSSSWTRVSKFCSFSGQPIADGVPFYYARRKIVDEDGTVSLARFCYLHADVLPGDSNNSDATPRPITDDDLKRLKSKYPEECNRLTSNVLKDCAEWHSISKFCFFSGGPINNEDTYYRAQINGQDIYLLVILSPPVTPSKLFCLDKSEDFPLSAKEVEKMDRIYDLSEDDFNGLRENHRGNYSKLPQDIAKPEAWEKVVPQVFLDAKREALELANARDREIRRPKPSPVLQQLKTLADRAQRGVETMHCGSQQEGCLLKEPCNDGNEAFNLNYNFKELFQDDASFIQELAENESLFDKFEEEYLSNFQRYSSRISTGRTDIFDTSMIDFEGSDNEDDSLNQKYSALHGLI